MCHVHVEKGQAVAEMLLALSWQKAAVSCGGEGVMLMGGSGEVPLETDAAQ